MSREPSLAELRRSASTPLLISIDWAMAKSPDVQLSVIERAVDWCVQELVKTRHHKRGHSEDQLTQDLITPLKAMGIEASHDTQIGGHVDIVVVGRGEFLWLAEAKKNTKGYDWLLSGFEQLDRRYSTGMPGQDCGEIIIFNDKRDSAATLAKWVEHLRTNRADVTVDDVTEERLVRLSRHKHPNTGLEFRVRHTIVPMFFEPTV